MNVHMDKVHVNFSLRLKLDRLCFCIARRTAINSLIALCHLRNKLTLAFLFRVQFVYIYEIWEMYIVHFSSLVTLILLFKVVCHATNVEGIHYPNYPLIIDFI